MYIFTWVVTIIFGLLTVIKIVSLATDISEKRGFRVFDVLFLGGISIWGAICLVTA